MKDELAQQNTELVAISKDSVQTAAAHKQRDGLALTLLADPELQVIKQYGVEHHKALEFVGPTFKMLGITIGMFPAVKTMAIPTTLLIDEDGTVVWIDQSDDYRMRSHNEHVLGAVRESFA